MLEYLVKLLMMKNREWQVILVHHMKLEQLQFDFHNIWMHNSVFLGENGKSWEVYFTRYELKKIKLWAIIYLKRAAKPM